MTIPNWKTASEEEMLLYFKQCQQVLHSGKTTQTEAEFMEQSARDCLKVLEHKPGEGAKKVKHEAYECQRLVLKKKLIPPQ
jgi:hypothetical protein